MAKKKTSNNKEKKRGRRFELYDLLRASVEMLGKGSISTVHRAALDDGDMVAVKHLKDGNPCARKDFNKYMDLIGRLSHPNIVPPRAYYYTKQEKLLIYDCLPQRTLFSLLHVAVIDGISSRKSRNRENSGGLASIGWRDSLRLVELSMPESGSQIINMHTKSMHGVLEKKARGTITLARMKKDSGDLGISVVSALLAFLVNFEDAFRFWAFVAKFIDIDFVEERPTYVEPEIGGEGT